MNTKNTPGKQALIDAGFRRSNEYMYVTIHTEAWLKNDLVAAYTKDDRIDIDMAMDSHSSLEEEYMLNLQDMQALILRLQELEKENELQIHSINIIWQR